MAHHTSLDPPKARSYLTVFANGKMVYEDGISVREIHGAGVTRENDGEYLKLGENLKRFCQEHQDLCLRSI